MLFCIVAKEISADAPEECIKAQCVIARTNLKAAEETGTELPGRMTMGELQELWGDYFSEAEGKIKEAIQETDGETLQYRNHYIYAAYHAVSAGNTRNMRASMLAITTQDYVKTARAKGLSPIRVVLKHQFKNSLVPIIPNLGVQIAGVLMGSFVVESMFLIPGLGRYFVDSVTNLDYPLIMGLTVFYGAFLVTMNLIVDVLYGLIDPRIRVK